MPASPEAYWKAPAIARLIRQARAGEMWEAIGLTYYPHAKNRKRVRSAAAEIFRRYATEDDRQVRAAAIRKRNWNKNPGLSSRADRRRRQHGLAETPVMRERFDPFPAGMERRFA